jgi:hypothetical protein
MRFGVLMTAVVLFAGNTPSLPQSRKDGLSPGATQVQFRPRVPDDRDYSIDPRRRYEDRFDGDTRAVAETETMRTIRAAVKEIAVPWPCRPPRCIEN